MSEYPTRPLNTVAKLFSGGTPSKTNPTYWNGNIPWLTPKDMSSFCGKTSDYVTMAAIGNGTRLSPVGSIFITVRGMSLHKEIRIERINKEICFNQDIKAIVPHKNIDAQFLYFALTSKKIELLQAVESAGHGTGRLPTDKLELLSIPDIRRENQEAIAAVLGSLDDKIDCNRRMNETLEAMARAIFKDWFVDFGPTRAKMEGRAPYLAQEVWDLFPDALDDEGKPVGWDRTPLSDVIELNPPEKLKKGALSPYLDMAALPTQGASSAPPIDREFTSGTKFRNGDTLLARITPCLENGKTTFVQCMDKKFVGWGSTEFIVMRSIPPIPKSYSYILARYQDFRRHAIQSMTGTSGRQRVTTDAIAAYPLTIPRDENVWLAFGALIEPIFQKIAANADESRTLAQTRDLLLPKLMSGEIRVKDAEEITKSIL